MSEEILNKLKEHDARFDTHDANFIAINKRFDQHDAKFLEHDQRFDGIDTQIEFLAQKSMEHDLQFEKVFKRFDDHEQRLIRIEQTMATKSDIAMIMQTLDYLVKLGEKHDYEMVMMSHGMFHLTERIEVLEKHCGIV